LHLERLPTLRCLRLVSKRFDGYVTAALHRTIVLEEDTEYQEQTSFRLIERLLDPFDALKNHVRSLHVKSFKGNDDSCCMSTELLLACLQSIRKLDSFRFVTYQRHTRSLFSCSRVLSLSNDVSSTTP
jgi:hypothetical protein